MLGHRADDEPRGVAARRRRIRFTANGDVARRKFCIYQDRRNGDVQLRFVRSAATPTVRRRAPALGRTSAPRQASRSSALILAVDWNVFVQLTVNGVTLGSVYALIALGYSLVYGILKLLNFAHGDVYMIGAFIGYGVLTALGGAARPDRRRCCSLIALMFVVAMLGSGVLGVVIERFAYRPLRDAPRIAPLISALGVSFFLQNSALLLFGADFRTYDTFEPASTRSRASELGAPLHISDVRASSSIVVGGRADGRADASSSRGRALGKAMRATSYDREAAAMMGIDVDRVIAITFFIGSALAGAAGVMFGLVFCQIYHFMGFLAGLKGFTAAVVGGIGEHPRRDARRPARSGSPRRTRPATSATRRSRT